FWIGCRSEIMPENFCYDERRFRYSQGVATMKATVFVLLASLSLAFAATSVAQDPVVRIPPDKLKFWFILEGQIEYKIGSLPIFLADQGDIVYVPKSVWHRAHHGGTGTSMRLAMNGYPEMLHNYQPNEEQK